MKSDKERLAEAIHALNELHEAAEEYYCSIAEESDVSLALELALVKADKVLEGG